MHEALVNLWTDIVSLVPRLLGSLGIFVVFWIAAIGLHTVITRVGAARRVHYDIVSLLGQALKAMVLALGLITALGTSGVNVAGLVAGLGLTGFALGFALKDILANVVAGAIIIAYRPFHPDDQVVIAGFEGRVAEIDMRYTTLETEDRRVLVPNSTVLTSAVSVLGDERRSGRDRAVA